MSNGNKKILVAVISMLIVAVAGILYVVFAPNAVNGSKAINVIVVDDKGKETVYKTRTDAEYLRGALEEMKDLKIEGTEGEFGLYVNTVNGVKADYETDKTYWSFFLGDKQCNYSIDEQPIKDGDTFYIKYINSK